MSKIYASTSPNGCLFQWNGIDAWEQVAPQVDNQKSISDLKISHSKNLVGISSPDNFLYQWMGNLWEKISPLLPIRYEIPRLYLGKKQYAKVNRGELAFFKEVLDKKAIWFQVAPALNENFRIQSLIAYNEKIYGGTSNGSLVRWNGVDAWEIVAPQLNSYRYICNLVIFENKIFGASADGSLLFWDGINTWTLAAPQKNNQKIMSLIVYPTEFKEIVKVKKQTFHFLTKEMTEITKKKRTALRQKEKREFHHRKFLSDYYWI